MPDETVTARPSRCAHCDAALAETDLTLAARFDKIDLPKVAPMVTRVERYAGHCRCCGETTLAPLPEGLVLIEQWRRHYNTARPHSSLNYQPPAPEVILPPYPPTPNGSPSSGSGQRAPMLH